VAEFAKAIGMVPIYIKKDQPGYIINSILIPILAVSTTLLATGVSDYESIDKTMMIAMKTEKGPFGTMDMIGIETVYHVFIGLAEQPKYKEMADLAAYLKANYIDKGNLGVKTGEGFYTYPNPSYLEEDFLK
jgi:3-hydroxybutyryl-CoA dehydrogenase